MVEVELITLHPPGEIGFSSLVLCYDNSHVVRRMHPNKLLYSDDDRRTDVN